MNENANVATLQSLLDHYRTKYYQVEFDYAAYQVQAKSVIAAYEQRISELEQATQEEGNDFGQSSGDA
jgi:hypothetical protein